MIRTCKKYLRHIVNVLGLIISLIVGMAVLAVEKSYFIAAASALIINYLYNLFIQFCRGQVRP
jgi:hypothetical protein